MSRNRPPKNTTELMSAAYCAGTPMLYRSLLTLSANPFSTIATNASTSSPTATRMPVVFSEGITSNDEVNNNKFWSEEIKVNLIFWCYGSRWAEISKTVRETPNLKTHTFFTPFSNTESLNRRSASWEMEGNDKLGSAANRTGYGTIRRAIIS